MNQHARDRADPSPQTRSRAVQREMRRVLPALGPATKIAALASLAGAVACESWLVRPAWHWMPAAAAVSALAGFAGGRCAPWPASAAILLFTYLAPVVALLALGVFRIELLLVWSAALTGLLLGDRDGATWSVPRPWRFALVLWALAVAVAWPITALREADLESLVLLARYNIPNTGIGGSPRMVIGWGADTAIIHLLGILWFDWLHRHAGRLTDVRFERWIASPMAASVLLGSLVALYQGFFDLAFLSTGRWASLRRASGPLADANAYGVVAALWTAGLLAFVTPSRRWRALALVGLVVCWAGLWMSGSRTALAAACLPLIGVATSALRRAGSPPTRLGAGLAGAGAALLAAIWLMPATPIGPVERLRRLLPSEVSVPAARALAREMWNRSGYGASSTALIAEHPMTGVGIGLFNLSGAAYHRHAAGHPPPDNAQNWWRHHVAELGFLGAAGMLLWTAVFAAFLLRTGGTGDRRIPAAAIKGALLALGLVSLVGMPAQSLPVSMTFWAFAFWYTRLVQPPGVVAASTRAGGAPDGDLRSWQWLALIGWTAAYAVTLTVLARGDQRPAARAAAGGWRYTYGIYDPGVGAAEGGTLRWTERHGVAVIANETPWLVLTAQAQHPDLHERPVQARLQVNGHTVFDSALHTGVPLTRVVNTGAARRAIIEAWVDRTWRPADTQAGHPDVGLSLSWRFVEDPPRGLPAISAPLPQ